MPETLLTTIAGSVLSAAMVAWIFARLHSLKTTPMTGIAGNDNVQLHGSQNSIHLPRDTSKEMLYFSLYKETQQALHKALEQQAFDRKQLELAQGRVARLKVKLQERESHIAELKAGQNKVPMLPFAVSLEPSSSRKHF